MYILCSYLLSPILSIQQFLHNDPFWSCRYMLKVTPLPCTYISSLDHARLLSYFLCLTLPSTLPFASEKRKDEGKERKKVHSLRIFRTNEIFRLLNHYFSHTCKVLPRIPYWMDGLQKDLRILPGFLNTVECLNFTIFVDFSFQVCALPVVWNSILGRKQ